MPRNALLSVFNKDGIVEFAKELIKFGFTIYSSGGTAKKLSENGIAVIDTAQYIGKATAQQIAALAKLMTHELKQEQLNELLLMIEQTFGGSILGHQVVTLQPHIHAGLLARDYVDTDVADLEKICGVRFDLVNVGFYPFDEVVKKPGVTMEEIIQTIDIGGPTMVKSAAKGGRIVICDPAHRKWVLDRLQAYGTLSQPEVMKLAMVAFLEVSHYYDQVGSYYENLLAR